MASSTSSAVASPSSTLAPSTSFETPYISTESTEPTATPAPVPLTTQYSFPSECKYDGMYNFTIGSKVQATHGYEGDLGWGTLVETFAYVNRSAPYYTSCYRPPGATIGFVYGDYQAYNTDLGTEVYRDAVCPESWIAMGVGVTSKKTRIARKDTTLTWGTAHCCRPGHTLLADIWSLDYELGVYTIAGRDEGGYYSTNSPLACAHSFDNKTFSLISKSTDFSSLGTSSWTKFTETSTSTYSYENGRAFYPAWSIEWMPENNTSLQPPWPTLTEYMYLATWTPGASVPPAVPPPATVPMKTFTAVVATVAVLAFLFALGCLFLLWKIRHAKQAAKKADKERIAEERSRTMMLGDDGEAVEPPAVQKGWWQRRRERQMARREPKSMELVEGEPPLR